MARHGEALDGPCPLCQIPPAVPLWPGSHRDHRSAGSKGNEGTNWRRRCGPRLSSSLRPLYSAMGSAFGLRLLR